MNEEVAYEAVSSLYALASALLRGDDEGYILLASTCSAPSDVLDAATVAVAQTALELARRDGVDAEDSLSDGGPLAGIPAALRRAALGAAHRLGDDEIRAMRAGLDGDPVSVAAQAVAESWILRWGDQALERSQELCLAIALGRESRSKS